MNSYIQIANKHELKVLNPARIQSEFSAACTTYDVIHGRNDLTTVSAIVYCNAQFLRVSENNNWSLFILINHVCRFRSANQDCI